MQLQADALLLDYQRIVKEHAPELDAGVQDLSAT